MTGANGRVSVVIPTYNRAQLVVRAARSAIRAIGPDDEIIVVDDGSTDGTGEQLQGIDSRLRLLRTNRVGPGAARNRGIREATGDFVAFLDSDDEWFADKIDLQRQVLSSNPELLFCYSDFEAIGPDGDVMSGALKSWYRHPFLVAARGNAPWKAAIGSGRKFSDLGTLPDGRSDFQLHVADHFECLLEWLPIWTSTFVARRVESGDALRFGEERYICEDWECFAKVARLGPGAFLACDTAKRYFDADNQLVPSTDSVVQLETRLNLVEAIWGTDDEYLEHNAAQYETVRDELAERYVKSLLTRGLLADARNALPRLAPGKRSLYGALTRVPWPVTRSGLAVMRFGKRFVAGIGRS